MMQSIVESSHLHSSKPFSSRCGRAGHGFVCKLCGLVSIGLNFSEALSVFPNTYSFRKELDGETDPEATGPVCSLGLSIISVTNAWLGFKIQRCKVVQC